MHHLFLLASISCFVAIMIFGFLDLVRELLTRNFLRRTLVAECAAGAISGVGAGSGIAFGDAAFLIRPLGQRAG